MQTSNPPPRFKRTFSLPLARHLAAIWRWLTEPPAAVQHSESRRRARLLSSFLAVIVPLTIFSILASLAGIREALDARSLLPGLVVVVSAYALNRTGHYAPAAALTIGAVFLAVGYEAIATQRVGELEYLLLAVLAGGLLFSPLFTVYIYLISLVAVIAFSAITPGATAEDMFEAVFVVGTVGLLSIVVTFLRQWDLVRIERQSRELALNEMRLSNILNTASEAIITIDERQRIGFFNRAAEQTFGYSVAEVLGQPLDLLLPPRFREAHQRHTSKFAISSEQSRQMGERREIVGKRKDGSEFPMEAGISKLSGDGHTMFTFIGSDITTRKLAQEALERSEKRLRALIEHSADVIALLDAQGTIVYTGPSTQRLFGYAYAEFVGRTAFELIHPDDAANALPRLAEMMQDPGKHQSSEYRVRHKDGTWRWVEAVGTNLLAEPGVEAIVVNLHDITERKQAAEALMESSTRFRTLFEASPDAIMLINPRDRWNILDCNTAACQMNGYTRDELVGQSVDVLNLTQGDSTERVEYVERIRQSRVLHVETFHRRKDGNVFPIEVSTCLIAVGGREVLLGIDRDITERKRTEEALRQSEEKYRFLFERNPNPMWVYDLATLAFLAVNDTAVHEYGYTRDDFLHMTIKDIRPIEDVPRLVGSVANTTPEMERSKEWLHQLHDGRVIEVEISSQPIAFEGRTARLVSAKDVTEQRQAQQQLRQRAEELAALYETTRDLSSQRDLPSLLQTIIDRAITLLGTPSGYIYLYDLARSDLELTLSRGVQLSTGIRLSLGEGMAGRVAQTLAPVIVDQYDSWENRSTQFGGIPFKAALGVPMLYAGELIGVLGVSELDNPERRFNEADAHLLSLFASQAAGAVHQARLLEETRARAQQLELLYDAGLTLNRVLDPAEQLGLLSQIAMRAVHADRAEFFRFDLTTRELVFEHGVGYEPAILATSRSMRFTVDGERGLLGWVSQQHMPLNLPDVSTDPRYVVIDPQVRSGLWVPVWHEDQPRGVLVALSTHADAFTAEDEHLLVLFANQIAVAMENTRLFSETAQRLAELEAVNKVSTALRVARTLDEMLPLLLDVTLDVMQAAQGAIFLYDPARDELRTVVTRGWGEDTGGPPIVPEKPGEGINGYVFATGEPYVASDFHVDLHLPETVRRFIPPGQGGVVIPIRAGDNVIGTFDVNVTLPREITPAEIRLLTTLSEIAGNAIQRTMLHQQTKRHLQHVSALIEVGQAITSNFDLRVSLATLVRCATEQLGVEAAIVLRFEPSSQTLESITGSGFRTNAFEHARSRLPLGQSLAGRAVLERRAVHIPQLRDRLDDVAAEPWLVGEGFVSCYAVPLVAKGNVKGVLEVCGRTTLEPDADGLDFLYALAKQAALAIDNATLFDDLQRSNSELTLAYDATIEGWSRALDLRDKETEGHTQRVTELTERLALAMGIGEAERVHIHRGALLHDIGKMGVPDSILLKPGPLTGDEWVVMRKHPQYAYDMLSPIAYLHPALDIPYCHHEKWDGTGYPQGLNGEHIPLSARIFAIGDVWDALRSDRPYRAAWPEAKVREHIRSLAGTHFDPKVVAVFLEQLPSRS